MILTQVLTAIRARFNRRSKLERITSTFTKTVNDLRNLHASHKSAALKNAKRIDALHLKNLALHNEADDALMVARNVEALLKR